jgi:uncharacterized protein YuzE
MRVTYDSEANGAYLEIEDIADGTAVENLVVERPGRGDIVLDFDANGHLLGVEIIGATELLPAPVLDAADRLWPECPSLVSRKETLIPAVQPHRRLSLSAHQVTSRSAMLEVSNRSAAAPRWRWISSSSHCRASSAAPAQSRVTRTGPIKWS